MDKSGACVDSDKIAAISYAPVPTTSTEWRGFLGLSSYYRRFIWDFVKTSHALSIQKSGKKTLVYKKEFQVALEALKEKLMTPQVLAYPEFYKPFIVETDTSSAAVGAVLAQKKSDGKGHLIQYATRTMNNAERNNSTCKREALAAIFELCQFRV